MPKRRKKANGQGSISYIKGRKSPRWARLPAQYDINGKEYRPTVGFFKTKKDAQKAIDEYKGLSDIKTFAEIYHQYQETPEYINYSKNNKNRYDRAFEKFQPIHNKNIADIKYSDLQAPLDQMELEGYYATIKGQKVHKNYSKDHIRRLKIVASKIYDIALKNDLVTIDLSSRLTAGGLGVQRDKKIFYKDEIQQMFNSIPSNPDIRYTLLLIFTGFRPNELYRLTKDNINFKKNVITEFGSKTEAGINRKMYIHPKIKTLLMELYLESNTGYILEYDNQPIKYDKIFYDNIYYPALKKAGVEEKIPYTCRYTFATIAHISGVDDIALQKLMGHENLSTTAKSYLVDVGMEDFIYDELKKIV